MEKYIRSYVCLGIFYFLVTFQPLKYSCITALIIYITIVIMVSFTAVQQPLIVIPPEPCVGDAATLRCEILVTNTGNNLSGLVSAVIRRDGVDITDTTPNHMLLRNDDFDIIGVVVSSITLDDDGIEYTCDAPFAFGDDTESSLTLTVTGTYTYYVHMYVCTVCVTVYWKTNQISHLAYCIFIGPANSHIHTLPMHCCINRLS